MVTKHKMKNTEIGFIPEDWDICSIDNEFAFLKSNSLSREQLNYVHGSVANVHYGDILTKFGENIDIKRTQLPLINHSAEFTPLPKDILKTGDIILADTAEDETAGKACEVIGITNESIVAGLHTIAMRPKQIHFAPGYLGYSLNASYYHDQLRPLMQGTKVISISKKALQETCIIYPRDINEQRAIVNVLTDIDTIIARLKEATEKKKQIKEGAMQRLLTGKVRLKGFKEPWVEKSMMEIGQTYNGITGKGKADFGHGNSRFITFLNILNNPSINLDELESVDIDPINDGQNEVRKGDLFFNTSSETPEDVGTCSTLLHDVENVYLNSFCFGFRLKDSEISGLFMSYYFRSAIGRREMAALAQGATRYNLSKDNFYKIVVTVPKTKEEQNAITKVLATMDSEISALEAERDKYISIKQGMMQKLLTGQIRLPQSCLKEE